MLVTRGRSSRGFTLVEMLLAITVFAILAAVALPTMRQFVANQRVRNVAFDLMASLTLARSEAITRGVPVQLAKTSNSTWDQGWMVTQDGVTSIQSQQPYDGLSVTDSASLAAVSYGKDGRLSSPSGNTKFTIAPSVTTSGVSSRCIYISLSGVPSSSQGACQ